MASTRTLDQSLGPRPRPTSGLMTSTWGEMFDQSLRPTPHSKFMNHFTFEFLHFFAPLLLARFSQMIVLYFWHACFRRGFIVRDLCCRWARLLATRLDSRYFVFPPCTSASSASLFDVLLFLCFCTPVAQRALTSRVIF